MLFVIRYDKLKAQKEAKAKAEEEAKRKEEEDRSNFFTYFSFYSD